MPVEANPQPTPAPEPSPAPVTPIEGAAPGDQSPAPAPQTPVKPEGLPDRYWDATTGLRTKEVADTLSAVEAENAKSADAFKDFPDKPEDAGKFYKLPEQILPEGMSLPEGTKFEPNQALLDKALPVFHKHKIAPEAFQELVRQFNAHEVEQYQAVTKEHLEDNKKLGASADTRRKAVADGLAAIVGPERAKFIDSTALSSDAVQFFEALIENHSAQNTVVPLRPSANEPAPTPPKPPLEERMFPNRQINQQKAG